MIIGSFLLMSINRLSIGMGEDSNKRVLDAITARNAMSIIKTIEFDFNRMGLGVNRQENALLQTDSTSVTFMSDINEDGALDVIHYALSDSTLASETENIHDRLLFRLQNAEPMKDVALGVTNFKIRYYDWYGNITYSLQQIKTFEISLEVQSTFSIDGYFSVFRWTSRISPPNIRRY